MLNIGYQKRKNAILFENLKKNECIGLTKVQNFSPIYTKFFTLNETNYNAINLDYEYFLSEICSPLTVNDKSSEKNKKDGNNQSIELIGKIYKNTSAKAKSKTNVASKTSIYIKYAPLLEPLNVLRGQYEGKTELLTCLPSIYGNSKHEYIDEVNNAAYVDALFAYLSSKLLHINKFVNAIDCYGAYVGIKSNFKVDVIDDLEYLVESEYFNAQQGKTFEIENYSHLIHNQNTDLPPISLNNSECDLLNSTELGTNIDSNEQIFSDIFINADDDNKNNNLLELSLDNLKSVNIEDGNEDGDEDGNEDGDEDGDDDGDEISNKSSSSSGCSSRTSLTSQHSADSSNESMSDCSYCSTDTWVTDEEDENENENSIPNLYETVTNLSDDMEIIATIPQFPVQVICLEKCDDILDNYILSDGISENEWLAILMQIIMTLLMFQKTFEFIHNDLHTNNIMYVTTTEKFVYYEHEGKQYKVPTYGKIFKIIDFGRAIFKVKGQLICSSDFKRDGVAYSQYNTEPYFNPNKKRIDPNYSFDLCRLACSIFDYLIDDVCDDNNAKLFAKSPVARIINEWCLDDAGRNILYKSNGDERYPEFKLYKMIARSVHKHTPEAQLKRPEFAAFEEKQN